MATHIERRGHSVKVVNCDGAEVWQGLLRDLPDHVIVPRSEWVRLCVELSTRRTAKVGNLTVTWVGNLKDNTP